MIDSDFGYVEITLEKIVKERGISKNKLAQKAELQRTQLNQYLRGEIQRVDLCVLARICCILQCEIGDALEYVSPEKK